MKQFLGFLTTDMPVTSRYVEEVLSHAGLFLSRELTVCVTLATRGEFLR